MPYLITTSTDTTSYGHQSSNAKTLEVSAITRSQTKALRDRLQSEDIEEGFEVIDEESSEIDFEMEE